MTHKIRRRILREATPEEKARHRTIRAEIQQELPELKRWAWETAARHHGRMTVGKVSPVERPSRSKPLSNTQ